jgi:hypothetical protein
MFPQGDQGGGQTHFVGTEPGADTSILVMLN